MARHGAELSSHGIAVFVIGFDGSNSLREMRDRLDSPFQFLRDASRHSYELMGLNRSSLLRTYLHPDVVKLRAMGDKRTGPEGAGS
jgi:peroxiredoxin